MRTPAASGRRLILLRPANPRCPHEGKKQARRFQFSLRVDRQLSILTPPGACPRHLILNRGHLWRTAKNQLKFEPRRNLRQNISRKAVPIRMGRARFCECPSRPISGMRPAARIFLRSPIQLAATLILPSATNFKAAPQTSAIARPNRSLKSSVKTLKALSLSSYDLAHRALLDYR
jgi:hypothetical protein